MEQLTIPDTNTILYPGSIVILAEYPYTKWIVKHGWYTYKDQQLNGWYFRCISDGTILSLSNVNMGAITLVSQGERPPTHCPPSPMHLGPHHGPHPGPGSGNGFSPREADQLRRAFVTVDSIKQRDALDNGNLPDGKLCRVNNVNGKTKYYAYDVSISNWIEQPIDFMTETSADEKYVTQDAFEWEYLSDCECGCGKCPR